jgi:hypothetical protein
MSIESKRGTREKTLVLSLGKAYFSSCSSTITPLPLLLKDELNSSSYHSHNGLNHSKWRRIEKDVPKCLVMGCEIHVCVIWIIDFKTKLCIGTCKTHHYRRTNNISTLPGL